MHNQFNLVRFGRLFRKHTAEHGKSYLLSVGVLLGLLAVLIGGGTYLQSTPLVPSIQAAYFGVMLLFSGLLFTSTVFSNFGDKKQAIAALTLPASHFEKYLVGWLYSCVLFTLVFIGCFYLVDSIVVPLDNWHGQPAELLNLFGTTPRMYPIIMTYVFLHAIAIWGAVYFEKQPLLKTAFAFFVFIAALALVNYQVVNLLVDHISSSMVMPFSSVDLAIGKESYQLYLPEAQENLVRVVPVVMALLFWLTAYLRVQEKEI